MTSALVLVMNPPRPTPSENSRYTTKQFYDKSVERGGGDARGGFWLGCSQLQARAPHLRNRVAPFPGRWQERRWMYKRQQSRGGGRGGETKEKGRVKEKGGSCNMQARGRGAHLLLLHALLRFVLRVRRRRRDKRGATGLLHWNLLRGRGSSWRGCGFPEIVNML